MARVKFISQWQYEPEKVHGEYNEEASLTLPQQTYSLREILRRSAVGMDVTSTMRRYDEYDDNPDVDDYVVPHGADISEVVNDYQKNLDEFNEEQRKIAAEKQQVKE